MSSTKSPSSSSSSTCPPHDASSAASSAASHLGSYKTLHLSIPHPGVLHVIISCGKVNAMSRQFWSEMVSCFERVRSARDVRVVLLSAAGRMFTAGLDLADHSQSFLTEQNEDVGRKAFDLLQHIREYQRSFSVLESLPQPVIACVHGLCIGGGVDLISACDMRMCSADATFSIKEVDIAMAADVGTLQRLPKIVGNHSLVREWAFTGRNVSADEALSCGLVSRVLPTRDALLCAGFELARQIAAKSPLAVAGIKTVLLHSRDHTVAQGLEHVALWNAAMLQSSDMMKAMQASAQKQPPIYSNL